MRRPRTAVAEPQQPSFETTLDYLDSEVDAALVVFRKTAVKLAGVSATRRGVIEDMTHERDRLNELIANETVKNSRTEAIERRMREFAGEPTPDEGGLVEPSEDYSA